MSLESGMDAWRAHLEAAARCLEADGIPVPVLEGKLLRPMVTWSLVQGHLDDAGTERVAMGALAIQMVHEASLLHDDILDGAETRRGRASLAADQGTAAALMLGDSYLTGAYRAAARTGLPEFLQLFITAVERTVAGEAAQARHLGHVLSEATYIEIVRGKSGELFGAAAALAAVCRGMEGARLVAAKNFGRDLGALYQRVDDFLDYCPGAETGKAPFQDYRQRKYTFILREAGVRDFEADPETIHRALLAGGAHSAMRRALDTIRAGRDELLERGRELFGPTPALEAVLDRWVQESEGALRPFSDDSDAPVVLGGVEDSCAVVRGQALAVGGPAEWGDYFGHHSKSFRFAARLFPPEPRADVEAVYAFCRFTDDLVDETGVPAPVARQRLEAWRSLVRSAYEGEKTGIPLADVVMDRSARGGAPFHYVESLLDGVAVDLEPSDYRSLDELEVYTYRVASVVGGWITELFGLHDPALLQRAYSLGHAMQLTNILRDVGEDWRRGRLYLPLDRVEAHGVSREDLDVLSRTGAVPPGYPELMEELIDVADRHYALAFEAIPSLPTYYRRPVAVAARVYQGIHAEIRRNGYDNGSRRAYTSFRRKLRLGFGGLRDLQGREPISFPADDTLLGVLAAQDGSSPSGLHRT